EARLIRIIGRRSLRRKRGRSSHSECSARDAGQLGDRFNDGNGQWRQSTPSERERRIEAVYAAPLHSCKYRWLHAPATKTLPRASRKSGGPFLLERSRIYPSSCHASGVSSLYSELMFDDLEAQFFENVLPAYRAFVESLKSDSAGMNADLRFGQD